MHDLLGRRLSNQRLLGPAARTPADAVAWLGAVQSQDYTGAKWAVGQRVARATDVDVERAFDAGTIVRTHILRPTWHFVAPADLRWMLALTGPRVRRILASYDRRLELDEKVLARSFRVIGRALRDRAFKTRGELADALRTAGIEASGQRLGHIAAHAELTGLVCSGPRRGRHSTYALVDERVPSAPELTREESLAELTRRYFASHGPATARDFAWWSGLTIGDARRGIESIGARQDVRGNLTYWHLPSRARAAEPESAAHLLPNYDEYLVAYKDREAVVGDRRTLVAEQRVDPHGHYVVIGGRLAGSWRAAATATAATVAVAWNRRPSAGERRALDAALERYSRFIGRPVAVVGGS
jgi:Winged helix DNA-binding domain